jgi:gliding motility-associated-like protein
MDSCSYQANDNDVIVVLPNTLNIAIVDSVSLCGNTPFTLSSASSGGYPSYSYQWFLLPNNNSISNTTSLSSTTPANEGNYPVQVVITDSCGYQQSDIQIINVLPPCQIEIPNVITPNGDLANDYFRIKNIEYHPNTSVTIFDRWGLKVFESTNYNNEWKGDGVSDGTFFYVIDVPQDKKYSGFITVFKK